MVPKEGALRLEEIPEDLLSLGLPTWMSQLEFHQKYFCAQIFSSIIIFDKDVQNENLMYLMSMVTDLYFYFIDGKLASAV